MWSTFWKLFTAVFCLHALSITHTHRILFCPHILQDGTVQATASALPSGVCLPVLPQQQGPEEEPQTLQVQVTMVALTTRGLLTR